MQYLLVYQQICVWYNRSMDKHTFIQKAALMQPLYKPSQAVREQLAQVDLIAVVGPTGAGKTSIMEHSGIPFVTSDVTRPARKGEDNGVDYNFRTDYDKMMQELEAGEFVQYVVNPNGEFYGSKASSFPAFGPCTMAIVATTIPLFLSLGFKTVVPVYILPPNYNEWMRRINAHRDKDLPARLVEAKTSMETALAAGNFHFIINDDLLTACQEFRDVAHGTIDNSQQAAARDAVLKLLTGIEDSNLVNPLDL